MEEEIIINTEVKNADKSEKQLQDLAKATDDAKDSAEEYEGTLTDAAKEVSVFGVSLNSLSGAFRSSVGAIGNSVKSLGAFRTALISTGIGAIAIALTGLVAIFTKTQGGIDKLSTAFEIFGDVVEVVIGRAISFTKALGSLLTLDIKGFTEGMTKAFSGLGDAIADAVVSGTKMAALLKQLERQGLATNAQVAINNREISKQKIIVEDTNRSLEDRIKAQIEAGRLNDRNLEEQQKLHDLEVQRSTDNIIAFNKNNEGAEFTIEILAEISRLQVQQAEIETAVNERKAEQLVKLNELQNQLIQENFEAEKKANQELIDIEVKSATEIVKIGDKIAKSKTVIRKKEIKDDSEANDLKRQLTLETAVQEFAIVSDLAGSLASLLGQESDAGKAFAVAQATINTFLAGTSALANTPGGPVLKGIALAATIATGLATVANIVSVPDPQVQISSIPSPFAKGGMINGSPHSMGGVMINAEGGEAVVNRRSMAIPWIKNQVSYLNTLGGGIPFMAHGGLVPELPNVANFANLEAALQNARPVLVTEDLNQVRGEQFVVEVTTTL